MHEDNDWGISLVSEDVGDEGAGGSQAVAEGISTAYSYGQQAEEVSRGAEQEESQEESLEELMAKMQKL